MPNAFATIFWDEQKQGYVVRTHTANGQSLETWGKLDGDTLRWGFDSPRGPICYTIHVQDGT